MLFDLIRTLREMVTLCIKSSINAISMLFKCTLLLHSVSAAPIRILYPHCFNLYAPAMLFHPQLADSLLFCLTFGSFCLFKQMKNKFNFI